MEVRDPDRLLVEDLAGGREEVVGGFGAVVIDVSINALGAVHGKAAVVGAGVGDPVANILLRHGKEGGETVLVELDVDDAIGVGAQGIGGSVIFESQVCDLQHIGRAFQRGSLRGVKARGSLSVCIVKMDVVILGKVVVDAQRDVAQAAVLVIEKIAVGAAQAGGKAELPQALGLFLGKVALRGGRFFGGGFGRGLCLRGGLFDNGDSGRTLGGAAPQPASSVREAAAERIRADRLRKFFMVYSPLTLSFVFPYIYPIGAAGREVKGTAKKFKKEKRGLLPTAAAVLLRG